VDNLRKLKKYEGARRTYGGAGRNSLKLILTKLLDLSDSLCYRIILKL